MPDLHPPILHSKLQSKHDYLLRLTGYLTVSISIGVGYWLGYLEKNLLWLSLYGLIYPHVIHWATMRFRRRFNQGTRTFCSLVDAIFCGALIAYLNFPIEITILAAFMLNGSFSSLGRLRLWFACWITMICSALLVFLQLGYSTPAPVPIPLTLTLAFGTLVYLSIGAFNSTLQAQEFWSLKQDIQQQASRFEELSLQVSKYVAPQVWESIFSGRRQAKLETQRKKLVVFFSDIVGFSQLSEQMEAEAFTDLLNSYLTDMSAIAMKHGGTIDKFIGDGIMIFFGDPVSQGTKRDALACVSMAIEMRRHMLKLRSKWAELGLNAPLQIRMGINTGYCTVGNFGTEQRMDYTIIGKEVNLASRLETEAESGEILISHETYALVKDKVICRQRGEATVKGFRDPIPLYQVVDFRRDLGANPGYVNHDTSGFSLYLDTDKIHPREKEHLVEALEKAANKLREKIIDAP